MKNPLVVIPICNYKNHNIVIPIIIFHFIFKNTSELLCRIGILSITYQIGFTLMGMRRKTCM